MASGHSLLRFTEPSLQKEVRKLFPERPNRRSGRGSETESERYHYAMYPIVAWNSENEIFKHNIIEGCLHCGWGGCLHLVHRDGASGRAEDFSIFEEKEREKRTMRYVRKKINSTVFKTVDQTSEADGH